jgi:MSHA biogenesis protein MshG
MPLFSYVARNGEGEKIQGVIDSADTSSLADSLSAQGLMLIRAQPASAQEPSVAEAGAGLRSGIDQLFAPRIGLTDLLLFCRQLATLLKAGVPLLRSLKGLEESSPHRRFAEVLSSLQQQLESGRELSASMKTHASVFSNYVVSMVRVGELTGRLPDVFRGLAAQMSFERENREAVRSALRYPVFVLATALAALVAVNIFVIPAFAKVYRGLKAELPALTKLLIGLSDFALAWWPLMAAGLIALIGFVLTAVRTTPGRRLRDALLLKLPIVGPLVHKAALARFTKSFGLALEAGVPVVDALQVANETTDNLALADRILTMRTSAERGESLARAARATGVFTPTILQMIGVGEDTGALGEMMNEVADHYQREVDYAVKGLAAQIEPVMILVLGGVILVFALGVFLPLWDLSRVALRN